MKKCVECDMMYTETTLQYCRRTKIDLNAEFICRECTRIKKYMEIELSKDLLEQAIDCCKENEKQLLEIQKILNKSFKRKEEKFKISISYLQRKYKLSHATAQKLFEENNGDSNA